MSSNTISSKRMVAMPSGHSTTISWLLKRRRSARSTRGTKAFMMIASKITVAARVARWTPAKTMIAKSTMALMKMEKVLMRRQGPVRRVPEYLSLMRTIKSSSGLRLVAPPLKWSICDRIGTMLRIREPWQEWSLSRPTAS